MFNDKPFTIMDALTSTVQRCYDVADALESEGGYPVAPAMLRATADRYKSFCEEYRPE